MGRARDQRGLCRPVGEMALGIVWKQLPPGDVGVKKDLKTEAQRDELFCFLVL